MTYFLFVQVKKDVSIISYLQNISTSHFRSKFTFLCQCKSSILLSILIMSWVENQTSEEANISWMRNIVGIYWHGVKGILAQTAYHTAVLHTVCNNVHLHRCIQARWVNISHKIQACGCLRGSNVQGWSVVRWNNYS